MPKNGQIFSSVHEIKSKRSNAGEVCAQKEVGTCGSEEH